MNTSAIATFLKDKVDLFRDISIDPLQTLVKGSRVQSFEAGAIILRQGDEATHFGVVLSGTIHASVPGDSADRQPLGQLKPGDTFNELALLTGDAVSADFSAESRCEVLLIPVSLFRSVIVAEPGAVQQMSRTIAARMQAIVADPLKAVALHRNADPYGLQLKGERPEKILVINCGSSSIKYSFYDTADESRPAHGQVERIGIEGTKLVQCGTKGEVKRDLPQGSFAEAFKALTAELTANDTGIITGADDVSVIAHRVVHGGEKFTEATLITEEVLAQIEALSPLAPLHNPVNVTGIREMHKLFSAVPHVAVFDTAFHHTLPAHAYLYGLPYEYYEPKKVRRYGFHGTSHHYVSLRAAQFLKRHPNELRLVSCHLGNGSSLCAVDRGRSVDTSMGFTPGEGLIMGTRCGDVDAGVLAFLERTENLTATQSEEMLNQKSGLLGLSGVSSDMREVQKAAGEGHPRALLALKAYCYRVRKYIGAYVAALGGLDAVIFTAGIGQGSAEVRALALQGLECMGMVLDTQRNRDARGFDEVCRVSTDDAKVAVLVVPTDEERMMAREALRALSRSYDGRLLVAQKQWPFVGESSRT